MELELTLKKLIATTVSSAAAPRCCRVVSRLLSAVIGYGIFVFELLGFL